MEMMYSDFTRKVIVGYMAGRKRAMEESLRWNLPMIASEDGKIVEITPDEIREQLANYPTNF